MRPSAPVAAHPVHAIVFRTFAATAAALAAVACGFGAAPLAAQQEFVRQRLLVHNFDAGRGNLGARVADAVEGAIEGAAPKDDPIIVSRWQMLEELKKAGYNIDSVLMAGEIRDITRRHRADEYVTGRVTSEGGRVRLDGTLWLTRDSSLKQPVVTAAFPGADDAAKAFGREVVQARRQLVPVRRCENAMRAGNAKLAADAASEGIRAYPKATVARACLLRAYRAMETPPDTMLAVATALLAIDSTSWVAWENAAAAHDELGNRAAAGRAWGRVATLEASDPEVVARVVNALMRDGNAAVATPIIAKAAADRPADEHLAGLQWRVLLASENWVDAAKAGEALRRLSPNYETQPDYFVKMVTAYRNANLPFRALAIASEGVSLHPEDADLYLLYAQLVLGESDSVLARGLQRFPNNGKILAYDAQILRRHGDREGALDATRRAIARDSTMTRGFLQLAQAFLDLQRPDSAVSTLRAGVRTASDSVTAAQFALARGNELYRSANASRHRADFEAALRMLQFSEGIAPSKNAGFLVGSTAFGVAQLAVTELQAAGRSCAIAAVAQDNLALAEIQLTANGAAAPEAARQFLDLAQQMRPYVVQQFKALCPAR